MATQLMPVESIRTLMSRIIDYAGLFPPAKLDMATTVHNYANYLKSDDSWMLGRLIVPVARLDEFEDAAAGLLPDADDPNAEPWQLSALMSPAGSAEFDAELERIEAFNIRHEDTHGLAVIDVVEMRADAPEAIDAALNTMPPDLFPFFELAIDTDPRGMLAALADGDAGAKVRTGGVSPELYPSSENLARFIVAAAAAGVPFKATAGLHHPLRHYSEAVRTKEFGFLNVFLAGCLALTHELEEPELIELLEEESLDAMRFTNEGIAWREHMIRTANVEDVREEFAVSFGSCSFDEPREDLRALKLL